MDVFEACSEVNDRLTSGDEAGARNALIRVLADFKKEDSTYTPLVNRLIREVGLFPYIQADTAHWEERFVAEAFKADTGDGGELTLHREQSRLLGLLLGGESVAVSAPTSFGKSFVIDAFVAIKKPANVVVIVPTIALADETRRRIQRKFGQQYRIITTANETLAKRNILIFPQERAIRYAQTITDIDLLIVDEFYKASRNLGDERSVSLIRAILRLSRVAKQRYFLAPNIHELQENPVTKGMRFEKLDFNTVVLDRIDLSEEIGGDQEKKSQALLDVVRTQPGKTLIYAGTYPNIARLSNLLISNLPMEADGLLKSFHDWLAKNYDPNWSLTELVRRGVGVHNGSLHRSLAQIQIRLFDEEVGLDQLVSTSSIIEGVNTSAQNVVLWSNLSGRSGTARINDFTFKNIIGRGGRMLRHFVGNIFILAEPPDESTTALDIEIPEAALGPLDTSNSDVEFTEDQLAAIQQYRDDMCSLLGVDGYESLQADDEFQSSDARLILRITRAVAENPGTWNGLRNLNSNDPDRWDHYLYELIKLQPQGWDIRWRDYVGFVKMLRSNWFATIPQLLDEVSRYNVDLDKFFRLERLTSFRLASLLSDVVSVYNRLNTRTVDLSLAISRIAHAFLPRRVYQLEEFGLPRMISKKLQLSGLIDLESPEPELSDTLDQFRSMGLGRVLSVESLDEFDKYCVEYFFAGIA